MELPLFLDRDALARRLTLDDHFRAAQAAFMAQAQGRTRMPMPMHIEGEGSGGFHAKGAYVLLDRPWVAVKVNSNFPQNAALGLPTIQGALLLFDAGDGRLLAILDSAEITLRRTAAASALAAVHLAREDARTIAVIGCGAQGRAQLAAIARVRQLQRACCWDRDASAAERYAREMSAALAIDVAAAATVPDATRAALIIVTATTAHEPFLGEVDVAPGVFIAAVGADSPHKSELHPSLLARCKVVVDSLEQAAVMGDLHHAIAAGAATRASVHGELADVVAGRKAGRTDDEEIIVFDSTGLAIQDVTAAAMACERSRGRQ